MGTITSNTAADLAMTLAPEDVVPGAYVAIARVWVEYPSFWWCEGGLPLQPSEPVRIECLPPSGGTPLRVEAVCLPFVLVRSPSGESQTLDVRSVRLVKLTSDYAKLAWKRLKKKTETV